MLGIRRSPDAHSNDLLQELPAEGEETNREWVARTGLDHGVILIGGSSVTDFRVRVAQSHARGDLLPSFWSLAGVMAAADSFLSVPFSQDVDRTPGQNAIVECSIAEFDDPVRYPNIAIIQFGADESGALTNAKRLTSERAVIDLPTLLVPWLAFVWGAGQGRNPLLDGEGVPSAAFAETAYGIAGIELTPGLSSASSCPEAIWQSAKWWSEYYEAAQEAATHETAAVPSGRFAVRQPAAAVVD
jgi:hypothetical protein